MFLAWSVGKNEVYFNGISQCLKATLMHVKYTHVKAPFNFWDKCMWDVWKVCSQTFKVNRTC